MQHSKYQKDGCGKKATYSTSHISVDGLSYLNTVSNTQILFILTIVIKTAINIYSDKLCYFENDQSIHEKGEINICEVFAVTQPKVINQNQNNQGFKSQFSLHTTKRVWEFKCDNTVEYNKWLKYLKKWATPQVIQSGYLHRKNQKTWEKHYFELNILKQLRYYHNENKHRFISVIHLPNMKEVKLGRNQLYG